MKREMPPQFEREHMSPEQQIVRSFLATVRASTSEQRFGNEDKTDAEHRELKQSLLEHVASMNLLAELILSKEPGALDAEKIRKMIWLHDIGELLSGDINRKKTPEDKAEERAAEDLILGQMEKIFPDFNSRNIHEEYEDRSSPEARFVKVIDVLDANLTMLGADRTDVSFFSKEQNEAFAQTIKDISPLLYSTFMLTARLLQQKKAAAPFNSTN